MARRSASKIAVCVARPVRSEPSQFAARALRPSALHSLEPAPKREPPRVATPTRAEESPASQVSARAHQSDPPIVTKPVPSKFGVRTLQPTALDVWSRPVLSG
jgi:hypothetical protein